MKAPNLISTKDLSYLEDMLSWNFLAMKKAHFLAKHVQDQDIKHALEKVGKMHAEHFKKLEGKLKS